MALQTDAKNDCILLLHHYGIMFLVKSMFFLPDTKNTMFLVF